MAGPRRRLLAALIAACPALYLVDRGDILVNVGAADLVMLAAVPWLVCRFLKGGIRAPLAALLFGTMAINLFSMIYNGGVTQAAQGPIGIGIAFVKALLAWLYFYAVANLIDTREDLLLALRTWLLTAAVVSLTGIAGTIGYEMTGADNALATDYRAHGVMGDPNFFCMHLGVSFLLAILYMNLTRRRLWVLAAMGLYLAGMFFSASRSGTLAFLPAVAIAVWWWLPLRVKVAGAVVLSTLAAAVLFAPDRDHLLASNPFTARFAATTIEVAKTDREALWEHALEGFYESPVIGVGFGNGVYFEPKTAGRIDEAHNTYLGTLSETGVLGLTAYLLVLGYFPVVMVAGLRRLENRRRQAAVWALVAAITVIAIAGIPVNVENYRGLWMLLGIAFAFRRTYLAPQREASLRPATAVVGDG